MADLKPESVKTVQSNKLFGKMQIGNVYTGITKVTVITFIFAAFIRRYIGEKSN